MAEHRIQFALKGKREHIAKVNMPNIASPCQHIDIEIPHGSRDHVIIPDTLKITFDLGIGSTDKARSVVNNVGSALVKKKGLLLLFVNKRADFANKNEEFYNPNIKKILTTINGMPHQLFEAGLQARGIYPELKKYFYKEHSNVT